MEVPLTNYDWQFTLIAYKGALAYVVDHTGKHRKLWAHACRGLSLYPGDTFDYGAYVKQFMNHVKLGAVHRAGELLLNEIIRVHAYRLWEQDGGQHGNDQKHWLAAEKRVLHIAKELIDAQEPYNRTQIINALLNDSLCDPAGIAEAVRIFDETERVLAEKLFRCHRPLTKYREVRKTTGKIAV